MDFNQPNVELVGKWLMSTVISSTGHLRYSSDVTLRFREVYSQARVFNFRAYY